MASHNHSEDSERTLAGSEKVDRQVETRMRNDVKPSDREEEITKGRAEKRQSEKNRADGIATSDTNKHFGGKRLGLYEGDKQLIPEDEAAAKRAKQRLAYNDATGDSPDKPIGQASDSVKLRNVDDVLNELKKESPPWMKWENDEERQEVSQTIYDAIKAGAEQTEKKVFPHRGSEDKFVDYAACKQAFKAAHLDKYPHVSPELIAAAMRNEQHFYKASDAAQDSKVKETGTVKSESGKVDRTASIGPAQIQIRKIEELIHATNESGKPKYEFLQHMKDAPLKTALDPKNAALLTAAYFAQSAEILKQMKIDVNDRTLAYTWNADVFECNGKYECPSTLQMRAEKQLPDQIKPKRRSVWNPSNDQILDASTHVKNVGEQMKYIRDHKLTH